MTDLKMNAETEAVSLTPALDKSALDTLDGLAKAATGGKWRAWITNRRQPEIYTDAGPENETDKIAGGIVRKADAALIVAAVNALPALITLARASLSHEAECDRLRAALGDAVAALASISGLAKTNTETAVKALQARQAASTGGGA